LPDNDEPAFREDLDMFIDRRSADIEIAGHCVDIEGLMGDHGDDLSAGGVGDRLEYVSAHKRETFWLQLRANGAPGQIFRAAAWEHGAVRRRGTEPVAEMPEEPSAAMRAAGLQWRIFAGWIISMSLPDY
jgi:hypothetical protein